MENASELLHSQVNKFNKQYKHLGEVLNFDILDLNPQGMTYRVRITRIKDGESFFDVHHLFLSYNDYEQQIRLGISRLQTEFHEHLATLI